MESLPDDIVELIIDKMIEGFTMREQLHSRSICKFVMHRIDQTIYSDSSYDLMCLFYALQIQIRAPPPRMVLRYAMSKNDLLYTNHEKVRYKCGNCMKQVMEVGGCVSCRRRSAEC